MSEKIGRHKGALETLLHEKKELSRLLQIVNSQIERHLSALEEEGVDTEELMENITGSGKRSDERARKSRGRGRSGDQTPAEESSGRGETGDAESMLEDDSGEQDFGDRDFSPT